MQAEQLAKRTFRRPCSSHSMFHPCCRPTRHPSRLLARKESDFIPPMKFLAAGAVCTVRHCASSALRDEGGGRRGELSWQSSGKIAVCTLVAKTSQQIEGMMSRLENAHTHTGSSDLCLWVVWQNARSCSVSRILQEHQGGGNPGLLLFSQPVRWCWRLLICQPCLPVPLSCLASSKNHTCCGDA